MPQRDVQVLKAGWRIRHWAAETDLSVCTVNKAIPRDLVRHSKVGKARLITTPPRDFLANAPIRSCSTAQGRGLPIPIASAAAPDTPHEPAPADHAGS